MITGHPNAHICATAGVVSAPENPARRSRPRTLPEAGRWTIVDGTRVLVDPTPDDLVEEIRRQFWHSGIARTLLTNRTCSAAQWRAVVRLVGRRLGRPVQTVQHGPEVRARLKDWPANDREVQAHHDHIRQRIAATKLLRAEEESCCCEMRGLGSDGACAIALDSAQRNLRLNSWSVAPGQVDRNR